MSRTRYAVWHTISLMEAIEDEVFGSPDMPMSQRKALRRRWEALCQRLPWEERASMYDSTDIFDDPRRVDDIASGMCWNGVDAPTHDLRYVLDPAILAVGKNEETRETK